MNRQTSNDYNREAMVAFRFGIELAYRDIPFSFEHYLKHSSDKRRSRVDLAYFNSDQTLAGIVEFKGFRPGMSDIFRTERWKLYRQYNKYKQYQVPVHFVISENSFNTALNQIASQLDKPAKSC